MTNVKILLAKLLLVKIALMKILFKCNDYPSCSVGYQLLILFLLLRNYTQKRQRK